MMNKSNIMISYLMKVNLNELRFIWEIQKDEAEKLIHRHYLVNTPGTGYSETQIFFQIPGNDSWDLGA